MIIDTEKQTLVLIRWDGKKGILHRHFLNTAMNQTKEGQVELVMGGGMPE